MVETNEKNPTDRFGKKPIQDKIKKIQEYSAFCMGGGGGGGGGGVWGGGGGGVCWTEESGDDNFYCWFLGQGQRNAQFELGFVCLDGDYHSQNQVGFEYCRWG